MIKIAIAVVAIVVLRFLLKWMLASRRNRQEEKWQREFESAAAHKNKGVNAEVEMVMPRRQPVRLDTRTMIERSWEFLARIADQVAQIFSPADKKKLADLGNILAECEMVYRHDPGLTQAYMVPSSNIVAPGFEKKTEKEGDTGKQ